MLWHCRVRIRQKDVHSDVRLTAPDTCPVDLERLECPGRSVVTGVADESTSRKSFQKKKEIHSVVESIQSVLIMLCDNPPALPTCPLSHACERSTVITRVNPNFLSLKILHYELDHGTQEVGVAGKSLLVLRSFSLKPGHVFHHKV